MIEVNGQPIPELPIISLNGMPEKPLNMWLNRPLFVHPGFTEEIKKPARVAFMYQLPYFEEGVASQMEKAGEIAQAMGLHITQQSITPQHSRKLSEALSRHGINPHYISLFILINEFCSESSPNTSRRHKKGASKPQNGTEQENEKVLNRLEHFFSSVYNSQKLPIRTREFVTRLLDVYSSDFNAFHEMAMKTFLFAQLCQQKEYPLVGQMLSMYRGHLKELKSFMESDTRNYDDNQKETPIRMIQYLDDPYLMKKMLETVSAQDLFCTRENEWLMEQILEKALCGPLQSGTMTLLLDKAMQLPPSDKASVLTDLFKLNAEFMVHSLTHPKRVEVFKDFAPKKEYAIYEELICHALKNHWEPVLQDFFISSLPRPTLTNFLSQADLGTLKNFYSLMRTDPQSAVNETYLKRAFLMKNDSPVQLVDYLNNRDSLPLPDIETLFSRPAHKHTTTDLNNGLYHVLKSFSKPETGAAYIAENLSFVGQELGLWPSHFKEVLLANNFAHYCVKKGRYAPLQDLKKYPCWYNPLWMAELLAKRDEKDNGNTALHYACQRGDHDFFTALNEDDYLSIKDLFFCLNNSAISPLDLTGRAFRKWLGERNPITQSLIQRYENAMDPNTEMTLPPCNKPKTVEEPTQTAIKETTAPTESIAEPTPRHPVLCIESLRKDLDKLKAKDPEHYETIIKKMDELSLRSTNRLVNGRGKKNHIKVSCERINYNNTQFRLAYLFENDTLLFLDYGKREDFYDGLWRDAQYKKLVNAGMTLLTKSQGVQDGIIPDIIRNEKLLQRS